MAKFIINGGTTAPREVEAESFIESGSYTEFMADGEQVFAIQTKLVKTITRSDD